MPPDDGGGRAGGPRRPDGDPAGGPEQRLRFARALSEVMGSGDLAGAPARLCELYVRLMPVDGASISLVGGADISTTWFASDEVAGRLAEAQYSLGDGPCQESATTGAPVFAPDLGDPAVARRWPVFAHTATGFGVRALFSFPLGTGGISIGSLDLYRRSPGGLTREEVGTALMAGDAVTFALAVLSRSGRDADPDGADPDGLASWLDAAESDFEEVHQAVGMVMVQVGVDPQQALDRIRARAFAGSRTVTEVAREVIARTLRFSADADGHSTRMVDPALGGKTGSLAPDSDTDTPDASGPDADGTGDRGGDQE